MTTQLVLVLLIVAGAALYVGRQTWRSWSATGKSGCGGGCGCAMKKPEAASTPTLIPVEQ